MVCSFHENSCVWYSSGTWCLPREQLWVCSLASLSTLWCKMEKSASHVSCTWGSSFHCACSLPRWIHMLALALDGPLELLLVYQRSLIFGSLLHLFGGCLLDTGLIWPFAGLNLNDKCWILRYDLKHKNGENVYSCIYIKKNVTWELIVIPV